MPFYFRVINVLYLYLVSSTFHLVILLVIIASI